MDRKAPSRKRDGHDEKPADPQEPTRHEPFTRTANEDDDGYDPWSDRPSSNPFWEEDPWR